MCFQDYINKDEARVMKGLKTVSPNRYYVNLPYGVEASFPSCPILFAKMWDKIFYFSCFGYGKGQNRGKKAFKWEINKYPKME
jgi:hypothetical protein